MNLRQRAKSRRAWGLALVIVILAASHLVVFAVCERASASYVGHKEITDFRAARAALESSLGLVSANAERWLAEGARGESKIGDYEIEIVAKGLPKAQPLKNGLARPIDVPREGGIAYRMLVATATARSAWDEPAFDPGPQGRRHLRSFRLRRRYVAMFQPGQPMRIIFYGEERLAPDPADALPAAREDGENR